MNLTKILILLAASAAAALAQLPQSRVLTLDAAQSIAQEVLNKCRADGYKVTVLVVDALNQPKTVLNNNHSRSSGESCGARFSVHRGFSPVGADCAAKAAMHAKACAT